MTETNPPPSDLSADRSRPAMREGGAHLTLTQQNALLAGIARIFHETLTCRTEEELGRVCLAVAEEVTESRFGFIAQINHQTGKLDGVAISDRGWELCRMQDRSGHGARVPIGYAIHGLYGRVLRGRGFFTNDPLSHPDSIGTPAGHPPLTAFLGVPLVHAGQTIGMVGLANREGGYGADDLAVAESLAPAIVQGFASKRAEGALREGEERLRQLSQFPEENPNPVLRVAADGALLYANAPAQNWLASFGWQAAGPLPDAVRALVADVREQGQLIETEISNSAGVTLWLSAVQPPGEDYVNIYCRDITGRKQSEEALRKSREDLDHAQAVAHTGSWRLDVRRNELVWSDEVYRIFGLPKETPLTYETFLAAVHPDDWEHVDRQWTAALGGEPYDIEHRIIVGGEIKWVREQAELEFDETGTLLGGFGTTQDITATKHAEEALAAAVAAAEEANQAKSQFLATMSHELRTPMNAILGMTDLALNEELPATVRDYLETAKESADVLLELLNQILDFSRIEAGRFELESCPFTLRRTVEQVVKTLGVRADEKGLGLLAELPDELPEYVVGDRLRLRQVLINLIGNAIKFTAKGEVVVRACVERRTEEQVSLNFSVSDTGPGIPTGDQEKIFSPFTQADASTTRNYGGSGLGLAITKKLVTLMGGEIWVESQPTRGSTFHFTVTLPIHQQDALHGAGGLPDREAFRDLSVLVVAESAVNRRILHDTLASWAMRPEVAADVPEALTKIHQAAAAGQGYRLVLADAVIPGIDGFTLAEWLGNEPSLTGPVILMLSATDRQSYPERCRHLTNLCLQKPISRSALFSAIAKALGVEGQSVPLGEDENGAEVLTAAVRPLRILLAEDTPANQKLVLYVLGNRGHSVEVACNGREALDLVDREEFDVVLMDVRMPEMDGYQATAAVRALANPKKAGLPIIAMTAHALKGDQQRCREAGMDAYLSKPINSQELIALVERLAAEVGGEHSAESTARRAESQTRAASPPALDPQPSTVHRPPSTLSADVLNLDEGIKRSFASYEMFQEMVRFFLAEADQLLDRIRTALGRQDGTEIARAAHRLKNTVVYLGANRVSNAIERVEWIGRSGDLSDAAQAIDELARELGQLTNAVTPHLPKP